VKKITSYYVIAPIDGLRMNFDYRMYSAELYGCPPDYNPHPEVYQEFREPHETLGKIPFREYTKMIPKLISDVSTVDVLNELPDRKMKDFTCIGFQIDFDESTNPFDDTEEASQEFFNRIIERGDTFLDPLRLCLFKPGKDESIGRFGAVGNGIQCFWIGSEDTSIRFIARKSLRYALTQKPLDILELEFGPIHADITFQGLCHTAFENPIDRNAFYNAMLRALKPFRESRDIQSPEARFRHLAAIAEDLAKIEEDERVSGNELRDRIAKISSRGWALYENINNSHYLGVSMSRESHKLIDQRYKDMGWEDEKEARAIINDLWSNVRNPLSHSLETFQTLERDSIKDIANLEKVVVTMINGWYAAYEVEEFHDVPLHEILLSDDDEEEND